MPPGANGLPTRPVEEFSTQVGGLSTSRSVRTATSTTSTSSRAPSPHQLRRSRQPASGRDGARGPCRRCRPLAVQFNGDMSTDPGRRRADLRVGSRRRRRVRRQHRRQPDAHLHDHRVSERASSRHRLAQCVERTRRSPSTSLAGAGCPVPMIGFPTARTVVCPASRSTSRASRPHRRRRRAGPTSS